MICVVMQPFTAYGVEYATGEVVDSGEMWNEAALIGARYLRPATPDEYSQAVGLTADAPADSDPGADSDAAPDPTPTRKRGKRR